jgi:osmotically-inducible protein OsmY
MLFRHHSQFLSAGIAAAALGSGMLTTAWAQDTPAGSMSQNGSDTAVAAQVKQALQSDSHLNSRHIEVAVQHGDVVLSGFVGDNRDLVSATQVATKAASGRKIINHLSIKQNYPNAP